MLVRLFKKFLLPAVACSVAWAVPAQADNYIPAQYANFCPDEHQFDLGRSSFIGANQIRFGVTGVFVQNNCRSNTPLQQQFLRNMKYIEKRYREGRRWICIKNLGAGRVEVAAAGPFPKTFSDPRSCISQVEKKSFLLPASVDFDNPDGLVLWKHNPLNFDYPGAEGIISGLQAIYVGSRRYDLRGSRVPNEGYWRSFRDLYRVVKRKYGVAYVCISPKSANRTLRLLSDGEANGNGNLLPYITENAKNCFSHDF